MDEQDEQPTRVIDAMFKDELLHKLDELRKANLLCDITVRAEGQCFPVHRHVLSAASDYFKTLFTSELQVEENQKHLVELNDMKSTTVAEVLEFIYTGEATISSSGNAQDLVVASDYLIIPRLKSKAAQFLEESLNASNCLAVESFASQYNCDSLKEAAIKYKCRHFVVVVKSDDFLSLGLEKVKELMCEDELNISGEEEVYEAVMAWIRHDLASRECFLPDLMKCLRLFSMSKYSLHRILNKEDLVIKNPICITILMSGLDYFLFPDRFLDKSLKHRTSLEKDEHVVVLTGGLTSDYELSNDTVCFVLSTKKCHLLSKMPDSCFSGFGYVVSSVCDGRMFVMDSGNMGFISCFYPLQNTWKSEDTRFSEEIGGQFQACK